AVHASADAIGVDFHAKSPRVVHSKTAAEIISRLPPFVVPVGVFVNEELMVVRRIMDECNIPLAQLHGEESPHYCAELGRSVIKALRVRDSQDLERMAAYQVSGLALDDFVAGT